jgi:hypothetical protein
MIPWGDADDDGTYKKGQTPCDKYPLPSDPKGLFASFPQGVPLSLKP